MRTPRLQAVDRTDAPADLNGLVHFAETKSGFCACAITFQTRSTNFRGPLSISGWGAARQPSGGAMFEATEYPRINIIKNLFRI